MTVDMIPAGRSDWVDSCGLAHLLRTFRLAMHPAKLVSALAAILLMFAWGLALDRLWTAMGNGVPADALARHVGITTGQPAAEESVGVFRALRAFETHCIRDAIESVRYGRLIGGPRAGESIGVALGLPVEHPVRGAFTNLVLMSRGFVWLCTEHFVYALLRRGPRRGRDGIPVPGLAPGFPGAFAAPGQPAAGREIGCANSNVSSSSCWA